METLPDDDDDGGITVKMGAPSWKRTISSVGNVLFNVSHTRVLQSEL